jgi:hypothetical protein
MFTTLIIILITLSTLLGISFARESKGAPIRSFLTMASLLPTIAGWIALTYYVLNNLIASNEPLLTMFFMVAMTFAGPFVALGVVCLIAITVKDNIN